MKKVRYLTAKRSHQFVEYFSANCNHTNRTKRIKKANTMDTDMNLVEGEATENTNMTTEGLTDLLKDIAISIGEIKTDLQERRATYQEGTQVNENNEKISVIEENLERMFNNQEQQAWQVNMLSKTVIRQQLIINELTQAIEKREKESNKQNITIDNLYIEEDEDAITAVNQFIRDKLKIYTGISIKDAYKIGAMEGTKENRHFKKDPPTILVQFTQPNMVGKIFSNIKNLKQERNKNKKRFFINKQLPARFKEEQQRIQQLYQYNRRLPLGMDLKIEKLEKGKIKILNEVYKKQVLPPGPAELLLQKPEDREERWKVKVTRGRSTSKDGSEFIGYSAFVKNHQDVRAAYLNIRELHADARHICCAFRLPGANIAALQDYVDDDEHGGGATLLDMLCEHNIFHRAIFVVRYYQGEHIGAQRHELMKEAATSAIIKTPRNTYTGLDELPWRDHSRTDNKRRWKGNITTDTKQNENNTTFKTDRRQDTEAQIRSMTEQIPDPMKEAYQKTMQDLQPSLPMTFQAFQPQMPNAQATTRFSFNSTQHCPPTPYKTKTKGLWSSQPNSSTV